MPPIRPVTRRPTSCTGMYKGVVLHGADKANRMDMLYNALTQTYVMFLKYDGDSRILGIATSPTP